MTLARFHESLPRESKGGGREMSTLRLGSMLTPVQRQPSWSCWLVMNLVSIICAGVGLVYV